MTMHAPDSATNPVSPATARKQLAAGGCFATLMLAALATAWLINEPLMQPEVLKHALEETTAERDQLREQLAKANPDHAPDVTGVTKAPIRVALHRATGLVSVTLQPPSTLRVGRHTVARALRLVVVATDSGVLGWIESDFGDGSTVRRVLRWEATSEDAALTVVPAADDPAWTAAKSVTQNADDATAWLAAHHPLRLQVGTRVITVGASDETAPEDDTAFPLLIVPEVD